MCCGYMLFQKDGDIICSEIDGIKTTEAVTDESNLFR